MRPFRTGDGLLLVMRQQSDKLPGPVGVEFLPHWLNVIKHCSRNTLG
jgi:hypothetical protein